MLYIVKLINVSYITFFYHYYQDIVTYNQNAKEIYVYKKIIIFHIYYNIEL